MTRFFLAVGLFLAPSTALACPGEAGHAGGKEGCGLPAAAATAPLPKDGTHIFLRVSGMTCGSCASHVQAALVGVKGVKGASVDAKTGMAEIVIDSTQTTPAALIASVNALGKYTAAPAGAPVKVN